MVYPAEEEVYSTAEIVFEVIFVIENFFDTDVPEGNLLVKINPFVINDAPDPFDITIVVGEILKKKFIEVSVPLEFCLLE